MTINPHLVLNSEHRLADQVRVSLTSVAVVAAELGDGAQAWLSDQEQSRYLAITDLRRKVQFVAGRWWARQCLASTAGGSWQNYALSAPGGAPPTVLRAPPCALVHGLHFSLSHSGDWLVCATASQPVGVDVEDSTRQRDTYALGEWIYGCHERSMIDATPDQERRGRFFALWTLKEAWIKQAPGPMGQAVMKAVQFMPCGSNDAQAMVLRAEAFTLAVVPATPSVLNICSPELSRLPMESWKIVAVDGF